MALKYVDWCSSFKLPCAGAQRNEVVLCLQSGAVLANPLNPFDGLECAFADALICQFYSLTSCPSHWNYRFSYDEEILADPLVTITTGDITGVFCRDCQTDHTECLIGASTARYGTATLVSGSAVVADTAITANSRIFLTSQVAGVTGSLRVNARTPGTSFTIASSSGSDAGVVAYSIYEP